MIVKQRVRIILCQNYMMFPLVLLTPTPLFVWGCALCTRSWKGGCCSISDDMSWSCVLVSWDSIKNYKFLKTWALTKKKKTTVCHSKRFTQFEVCSIFQWSIVKHSDIVLLHHISLHKTTVYLIWPRGLTYIDIGVQIRFRIKQSADEMYTFK